MKRLLLLAFLVISAAGFGQSISIKNNPSGTKIKIKSSPSKKSGIQVKSAPAKGHSKNGPSKAAVRRKH